MSRRRRSMMSEELKTELAKELGFYETVEQEGWGGIRAVDAGNMVKRAIQLAEQAARGNHKLLEAVSCRTGYRLRAVPFLHHRTRMYI